MNCSCKFVTIEYWKPSCSPTFMQLFSLFFMPSWENFNSNKRKGSTRSLLVAGGVKGSRGIDGHSPQNRPSRFRSEGQEEEGEYVYITVSSFLTKGDGWQPPFHSRSLQNEFWIEYFLRREFLSLCLSHCLSPSILSFYLSLSGRTRQNRNQESGARYSSSSSSSSSSSLSSSSHTNRGCLVTRKLRKHCELGKSILDLVAAKTSNHSELFSSRRVRNKPWP